MQDACSVRARQFAFMVRMTKLFRSLDLVAQHVMLEGEMPPSGKILVSGPRCVLGDTSPTACDLTNLVMRST